MKWLISEQQRLSLLVEWHVLIAETQSFSEVVVSIAETLSLTGVTFLNIRDSRVSVHWHVLIAETQFLGEAR